MIQTQSPSDPEASFDSADAVRFLREQGAWLRRGLKRADDPSEVGLVLGTHDATHESWLRLIATVEQRVSEEAAQHVAVLYGFHGRVVGSLERGIDGRLQPEIAREIHRILSERLDQLTDAAIDALEPERAATARPLHVVSS